MANTLVGERPLFMSQLTLNNNKKGSAIPCLVHLQNITENYLLAARKAIWKAAVIAASDDIVVVEATESADAVCDCENPEDAAK
ncbi:MAG: hypothetical protein RIA65_10525 [Woeseia sp.]